MKNVVVKYLLVTLLVFTTVIAHAQKRKFENARQNNVCKVLKNDVLLYFVFIDTRTTYPWTEFDILSTIDSIHLAERWLEKQAESAGIELNIKTDYYIGDEFTTISRNLPKDNVAMTLSELGYSKGVSDLNRWGDYVSKTIGESLFIREKDGIPTTKKPSTKERLTAHLRDEYNVESVALMFFVNNYFKEDLSIVINTMNNDDIEFAIVSYKYPSEIAHYFIKLFGGIDLYKSSERKSNREVKFAEEYFPNDIMQSPKDKNLRDLSIGEFTAYMIGWKDNLNPQFSRLLNDRIF